MAQVVVPVATLPRVGDTLRVAVDNLPNNINVGNQGGNQTWFFGGLQAPFVTDNLCISPDLGVYKSHFPNATYMVKGANNIETYYRVENGKLLNLGFAGAVPFDENINAIAKYSPPYQERTTPLNYQDKSNITSTLRIPFSAAFLPDTLFADLPIRPDSIRITQANTISKDIDAWGSLTIPSGIFDVLRQRMQTISARTLEIKASPIPAWIPFQVDIPGITGTDTIVTYTFFSHITKEPIAVVTMDENQNSVNRVEFKADNHVITNTYNKNIKAANIYAYPNPAIGSVRFDLVGLDPGKYTIKIFNILGVEVWSQRYTINGSRTIRMDLDGFNRGTYLYSLVSENGRSIATKRLIVLRP